MSDEQRFPPVGLNNDPEPEAIERAFAEFLPESELQTAMRTPFGKQASIEILDGATARQFPLAGFDEFRPEKATPASAVRERRNELSRRRVVRVFALASCVMVAVAAVGLSTLNLGNNGFQPAAKVIRLEANRSTSATQSSPVQTPSRGEGTAARTTERDELPVASAPIRRSPTVGSRVATRTSALTYAPVSVALPAAQAPALTTPGDIVSEASVEALTPIPAAATRLQTSRTVASRLPLIADTSDPDQDVLTVTWSASAGSFDNPAEKRTLFTCPDTPRSVAVTVTVTDGGGGIARDTITVNCVGPVR